LYIGTSDGFLVYYELDQGTSASGKLTCSTKIKAQQHTGSSKPVKQIMLAPDQKKLLVLVDGKLLLLDMFTLKPVEGSKVTKGCGALFSFSLGFACRGRGRIVVFKCFVSVWQRYDQKHDPKACRDNEPA
jgi:hypothetical protein